MLRYTYDAFEINRLDEDNEEHLMQREFTSAYEAVTACLDPSRRLDYLQVNFRHNDKTFGEISPYATWSTKEAFEEALRTHILAFKIQTNVELSQDRATEDLIVSVSGGR